jgi:hypothetical protein
MEAGSGVGMEVSKEADGGKVSSSEVGGNKIGIENIDVTSPRTIRSGINYGKKRF